LNTYPSNKSGLKLEKFFPDPLFNGKIKISQPETGYRFSMDSIILAAHVLPEGFEKIIDIGCGCAIMPLILAFKNPDLSVIGIEIQKELFEFAGKNIIANHLENTIQIIHKDIKDIRISDINGPADIILSNPPYKKKGTGRLNPNPQKAIARHELTLDIDLLFSCSQKLLSKKGKLYIIFPADRLSDLSQAMEYYKFSPRFLRYIHIKKNHLPRRVILCAIKNNVSDKDTTKGSSKSCNIRPPLFIYTSKNKYSDEAASLFNPV